MIKNTDAEGNVIETICAKFWSKFPEQECLKVEVTQVEKLVSRYSEISKISTIVHSFR